MPIYSVHHVTTYSYRQPVAFGEHRMMFLPRESHDQHLLASTLTITPEPVSLRFSDDALGNRVGVARFSGRASKLVFDSHIRVAQSPSHLSGFNVEPRACSVPVAFEANELNDLRPFVQRRYDDPHGALDAWARGFLGTGKPKPTLEFLTAMIHGVRTLTYVRRTEKGIQNPAETLACRSGTCRDFTELVIEALRALGLPTRFVSGYLYVAARDRHDVRGGGATHAWLQVFLPGAGWLDIDPTNGTLGNDGLIRIAFAREPIEALPLAGSYSGFPSDALGMEVTVKVVREAAEAEPGAALEA